MRKAYVVGIMNSPIAAVTAVTEQNYKRILKEKTSAAEKFLKEDLKRLIEETGLDIKAELPPNVSSYSCLTSQELMLQVLEHFFQKCKILRYSVNVFRLGSIISHKTEEMNIHALADVITLKSGMINANTDTADKACSSGLLAVARAAQAVERGEANIAIGAGLDMMCRVANRKVLFGLTNPFDQKLMAGLADEWAKEHGVSRDEMDDFAAESYERARAWQGKHRWLAPIKISEDKFVEVDEEVEKHNVTRKLLGRIPPYPQSAQEGTGMCERITPGNSAKYGSAAGFIAFADKKTVEKYGMDVMGIFEGFAEVRGYEPRDFISKPELAIQKNLDELGLKWSDIGHIEENEAFLPSIVEMMKQRGLSRDMINSRGGAVAHGHPLGGTGPRLFGKSVDIMLSQKLKRVAVAICNAVDGATAAIIRNPYVK